MTRFGAPVFVLLILSTGGMVADAPQPLKEAAPATASIPDDSLPAGAIARFGSKRAMHGITSNIVFSPDGKYIAAAGYNGAVVLREAKDFGHAATYRRYRECNLVAFAPDGKSIAFSEGRAIRILDVDDGGEQARLEDPHDPVSAIVYHPDGKRLLCGADRRLVVWDLLRHKIIRDAKLDAVHSVRILRISRDGKRVAIGDNGGRLRIWDIDAWKESFTGEDSVGYPEAVFFHPDGKHVGIARTHEPVTLYEEATGKRARYLPNTGGVAAVSADGAFLASAVKYRQAEAPIHIFDLKREKKLITLKGHRDGVERIAFAPDGKTLVSFGRDNTLRKWDVATGKEIGPTAGHQHEVTGVAFIDGGRRVVSRSLDRTLRFWDPLTGKEAMRLTTPNGHRNALAISPDRRTLAWDEILRSPKQGDKREVDCLFVLRIDGMRNVVPARRDGTSDPLRSAGTALRTVLSGMPTRQLAFAADGRHLDVSSGNEVARFRIADNQRTDSDSVVFATRKPCCRLSPDGKYLIAHEIGGGWEFSHILCRERATDRVIFERKELAWRFTAYAFSPTSPTIAICGEFDHSTYGDAKSAIQIWRLSDGQLLRAFENTRRIPWLVQFSPDGRLLAAADEHGISLYETHTGREVDRFRGHDGRITCLDFSPDGKLLVTGSDDTTLLVWDLTGILQKGQLPENALEDPALVKAFEDLASDNAAEARRAIWRLVGSKTTAARFLAKRLDVASDDDLKRLPEWIARLDAESFKARDQAAREIEKFGPAARPALEKARSESASPEVREGVERLLKRMGLNEDAATMPRLRRAIRVIEVLEWIDTPESRQLLVRIQARGVFTLQKNEARFSVGRFGFQTSQRIAHYAKAVFDQLAGAMRWREFFW